MMSAFVVGTISVACVDALSACGGAVVTAVTVANVDGEVLVVVVVCVGDASAIGGDGVIWVVCC